MDQAIKEKSPSEDGRSALSRRDSPHSIWPCAKKRNPPEESSKKEPKPRTEWDVCSCAGFAQTVSSVDMNFMAAPSRHSFPGLGIATCLKGKDWGVRYGNYWE